MKVWLFLYVILAFQCSNYNFFATLFSISCFQYWGRCRGRKFFSVWCWFIKWQQSSIMSGLWSTYSVFCRLCCRRMTYCHRAKDDSVSIFAVQCNSVLLFFWLLLMHFCLDWTAERKLGQISGFNLCPYQHYNSNDEHSSKAVRALWRRASTRSASTGSLPPPPVSCHWWATSSLSSTRCNTPFPRSFALPGSNLIHPLR